MSQATEEGSQGRLGGLPATLPSFALPVAWLCTSPCVSPDSALRLCPPRPRERPPTQDRACPSPLWAADHLPLSDGVTGVPASTVCPSDPLPTPMRSPWCPYVWCVSLAGPSYCLSWGWTDGTGKAQREAPGGGVAGGASGVYTRAGNSFENKAIHRYLESFKADKGLIGTPACTDFVETVGKSELKEFSSISMAQDEGGPWYWRSPAWGFSPSPPSVCLSQGL